MSACILQSVRRSRHCFEGRHARRRHQCLCARSARSHGGAAGWTALRSDLCRQGSVRRRRASDQRRQPGLGAREPGPDPACLGRAAAARRRRDPDRQDDYRRGLARHRRRECILWHTRQPAGAWPSTWRLFVGLGRRGRRRDLRHRPRHRYGRLGSRAGQLLWALRHSADAWPASRRGHAAAGAQLRHHRLVRARWRHLRQSGERHARRADPVDSCRTG